MNAKCGTYAGWAEHRRRNEKPCDACRVAKNEYNREWKGGRRRRPIKLSEVERKRRAAIKQQEKRKRQKSMVEAWKHQQRACVDCGLQVTERNLMIMQCDHIAPQTKAFTISEACGGVADHQLATELAKCVLRCANCHGINSYEQKHHLTNRSEKQEPDETLRLFDAG